MLVEQRLLLHNVAWPNLFFYHIVITKLTFSYKMHVYNEYAISFGANGSEPREP